jgi:DNA-binding CsgD family transcriptional regulator/energy-coupling factor transporter ATP-binding protein EcfA2
MNWKEFLEKVSRRETVFHAGNDTDCWPIGNLTESEKNVLVTILPTFDGGKLSQKDVATKIFITEATVKCHLKQIYEKFRINSGGSKIEKLRQKLQAEFNPPLSETTITTQALSAQTELNLLTKGIELFEEHQKRLSSNPLQDIKPKHFKDVYVPLGLVERKTKERPQIDRDFDPVPDRDSELNQVETKTTPVKHCDFMKAVIDRQPGEHIVILGEPGAGKTTLLTSVWQSLLKNNANSEIPSIVAWISLADLGNRSLEDYVEDSWLVQRCGKEDKLANLASLTSLRKAGRLYLLLDGADEIGGDGLQKIYKYLDSEWAKTIKSVVTCRLNLWDGSGRNELKQNFKIFRTLEFRYGNSSGADEVEEFILKWFNNADAGKNLRTALEETGKERIKYLAQNPLRLTLLCNIWQRGESLPDTQAGLYKRFVNYCYGWSKFPQAEKLRGRLDPLMGKLAKYGINKSTLRFRFTEMELRTQLQDEDLIQALKDSVWLNFLGTDWTGENIYTFFHPTFQEYFAACSISDDDWDYFLPREHEDQPIPCQRELVPTYRVFEQEWRQVILFWTCRRSEDISDAIKEEFIKRLTDFQGQDGGFYRYRAYIMAAIVVGEFKSSKQAELIVEKIIEYAFGYFIPENNKWRNYLYSGESFARATIPFTHRQYAIKSLKNRLSQSNSSDDLRSDVESALYQITMSSEKIVEEDNWKSSDDLDFYVDPFDSEFEKQRIKKQRIEKAITSFNQNDYRNCSVDIKILSQAVGNEQAINALIAFIGQYKYHGISTVCYGFNAAVALGKIAVGNKSAIKDLIDILQNNNANYKMYVCVMYVAIRAIVTRSEMPLVIKNVKKYLTKESCESNFHRFNNCYIIVFQYAQSLTYPEFYKAWHQREDRASLNLEFSKDN